MNEDKKWGRVMRRLQEAGFPIDPKKVAELTIVYLRRMHKVND